jgi:hypothetical protein
VECDDSTALAFLAVIAVATAIASWHLVQPIYQARFIRLRKILESVMLRLEEARRYVERDRAIEQKKYERQRFQILTSRERLAELEDLFRSYLLTQQSIDAMAAANLTNRARESLASDFGELRD